MPQTVPAYRRAFGQHIKELRRRAGWSQEAFAHHIGIDRTCMSGIERGVRNPTLDVPYKLAHGLGVEVAELFPR